MEHSYKLCYALDEGCTLSAINKQVWLAILLIVALVGCSKPPESALRVGSTLWVGYEPLYLARASGYISPDKVKLVEYTSATQVMRGLTDGAIEAGMLTLDEVITIKQMGADVLVVLALDYSDGGDGLIVKPEIKSLSELKGRRVGVEVNAVGAYMMQEIVDHAGLSLNDVELVSVGFSRHEEVFTNQKVDAVVTYEPYLSHLVAKGGVKLFDSKQMQGKIVDVLVIRRDALTDYMVHLKYLVNVWFKVLDDIAGSPESAAAQMGDRLKFSGSQVLQAMQGVKFLGREENKALLIDGQLREISEEMMVILKQNGLILSVVDTNELYMTEVLEELYK